MCPRPMCPRRPRAFDQTSSALMPAVDHPQ
jgi:hypothetical protein